MNLRATVDTRLVITPKHRSEVLRLGEDPVINTKSGKSLTVVL
jgi:hypothetical protein